MSAQNMPTKMWEEKTLDPFDDEAYKKSNVPFYAVVTNVATGNPEYIQIHSVFEQMDTLRYIIFLLHL